MTVIFLDWVVKNQLYCEDEEGNKFLYLDDITRLMEKFLKSIQEEDKND